MVVLACADEMCPLLFGLKGLDPTCATCAGKPHVLLECRLQLHFDSGSGALSLSCWAFSLWCALRALALVYLHFGGSRNHCLCGGQAAVSTGIWFVGEAELASTGVPI